MPHQCTTCDLTFEDGSKEMLGGCPECGGNKFQFLPAGKASDSTSGGDGRDATVASSPQTVSSSVSSSPSASGDTGRKSFEPTVADESTGEVTRSDDDIIEAPTEPVEAVPGGEDRAQASARRDVVSEDELPVVESNGAGNQPVESTPPEEGTLPEEGAPLEDHDVPAREEDTQEDDRPDLSQLRQELNDQFESIKILRPGEYELNLMELYDRQEYIIALEEDGRYVIDVPDTWRDEGRS